MSKNKITETTNSVELFLKSVENETRRKDAFTSLSLYKETIGLEPRMWGPSMIGFGNYHYKYDSGREGNSFRAGFSPRKASMAFYIMAKFAGFESLLEQLGKHKMTKSCLYVNKLSDVDIEVLKKIIASSFTAMNKKYPLNE
jgi:hypothetical protein